MTHFGFRRVIRFGRIDFLIVFKSRFQNDWLFRLGAVDDESWAWVNGRFVGEVTKRTNPKDYWQSARLHPLPAGVLKPGRNVIVVLCNDTFNHGGILGTPKLRIPAKYGFYTDTPVASDDPYRYYRW